MEFTHGGFVLFFCVCVCVCYIVISLKIMGVNILNCETKTKNDFLLFCVFLQHPRSGISGDFMGFSDNETESDSDIETGDKRVDSAASDVSTFLYS